jgi:ATP-dependent helicase HrpA
VSPQADSLADRLDGLTIRDRHRLGRRLARATHSPRGTADRELDAIAQAIASAEERRALRAGAVPTITYPEQLPVSARRAEILEAIRRHQVVVVAGETGSGKTTQIPKMCLELGRGVDGMIGHTQPRRIAARTVAERLAEELETPLGGAVGYCVRFADTVGDTTLVKVMTDGILLAEIRSDPLLTAYDTIVVDEAHERSLNIDFLLGYLTQLLPKRSDLKVVVTSATIDTARFAAHFNAPVVEVSGRTFPVEIRYRPVRPEDDEHEPGEESGGRVGRPSLRAERDRDPIQALCDAVAELVADGPGDVLVFLPGERDIRDAADALRSSGPEGIEILPLYARLSAAEQHRVFRPHGGRRIVLATNVAETSLTVPGIRSVVDTGLVRISRYSHRTKVQRLPIEPASRASADQRAGRCGRVAPGTCIRLYAEDDYAARPEFTDPEILRTNLASVVLQMAAAGLGDIESFPFIEPPDRRSIADGRALLEELGAIETRAGRVRLTPIGRRLAQLPLDPRLARMVLAAEEHGCLREVTIITAALSVPDPRERPADKAQAADELHRRFAVPDSDFLGLVRLWDYLADLQSELSGNQFRKRCRSEYLSVLRIREWQDVASQIRQSYRAQGLHASSEPARPEQVHQALLAGLLSRIGVRDRLRGDYQGAANVRFQIGRSSTLARSSAPFVMAGELVETERTWARTAARIDPVWAERAGAHLVRRSYTAAWWDPRRGEATTEERVTLYGVPIVAGRRVSLGRIDPPAARALFIQHALVERDWPVPSPPLERNDARVARVRALEERVRRPDLLTGDEAIFDFYDSRLPGDVTNAKRFERWWTRAAVHDAGLLDIPYRVLLDPGAGAIDLADYPIRWTADGLDLPLRYRWAPGEPDDGVTVQVSLAQLSQLRPGCFDWHVPGLRAELVTTLVRLLPKPVRRALVPAAEVTATVLATSGPADGDLLEVVARRLGEVGGVAVSPTMWDLDALPAHLRILVEAVDSDGSTCGRDRDVGRLRRRLQVAIRAAVGRLDPGLERHGVTAWDIGDLPRVVEHGGLRGYPALVDEGDSVGVVILDSVDTQEESMWSGTRRLLLLAVSEPAGHLQRRLSNSAKLAVARSGANLRELLADCTAAAADQIVTEHGGPAFDAAGFAAMATTARRELLDRSARLAATAAEVLAATTLVSERAAWLETRDRSGLLRAALADVRAQLGDLVYPGFVAATGADRLVDLRRYLAASERRLERLPADIARDAIRQATIGRVRARYDELASQQPIGSGPDQSHHALTSARWMIEELRVSLWAQSLGTPAPVSEERILRTLERAVG